MQDFVKKYSGPIYQDIIFNNELFEIGTDSCAPRYQMIQPILDQFDGRSFSVLDLGAAQGYFSFRIADDYPESHIAMIEANNTSYYAHHGDMLYDLCQSNSFFSNIAYLEKRVDINDLEFLNSKEHFDVLMAFLVVHLMESTLEKQIANLNCLLKMTDNLIIEVANDVSIIHTSYVEYWANKWNAIYLGEVKRHKDPLSTSTGRLYWIKNPQSKKNEQIKTSTLGICKETFLQLNGKFPSNFIEEYSERVSSLTLDSL